MATRILGPTGSKKRRRFLLAPVLLVAIVAIGALMTGGSVFAAPSTDASVSEYSQCANGAPPSTTTACPQNWINGILNPNNSGYHEDQNTAQRLFLDLPRNGPTTGRKIILKYLARKGQGGVGNHAYDSLGQWNYTQTSADRCQGVTATNCPGGSESKFTIPVDNTVVADSNGAGSSTALHELPDANRYMSMFGGTITNITAPVHDNAAVAPTGSTGTVAFRYYGSQSACTADTAFTGGTSAGSGKSLDANSVAKSDTVHITSAGVTYWRAHFTATGISTDSDSGCSGEILTANQATSTSTTLHQTDADGNDLASPNNGASITVPVGAYVKDFASILPASVNSGTVIFRYYATQAACSADTNGSGGSSGGSGSVSSGSASGSVVQFNSAGVFYWRGFFSGGG